MGELALSPTETGLESPDVKFGLSSSIVIGLVTSLVLSNASVDPSMVPDLAVSFNVLNRFNCLF